MEPAQARQENVSNEWIFYVCRIFGSSEPFFRALYTNGGRSHSVCRSLYDVLLSVAFHHHASFQCRIAFPGYGWHTQNIACLILIVYQSRWSAHVSCDSLNVP